MLQHVFISYRHQSPEHAAPSDGSVNCSNKLKYLLHWINFCWMSTPAVRMRVGRNGARTAPTNRPAS
jgi:hypothetical protein